MSAIVMTINAENAFEFKEIIQTIATAFSPSKAVTENGKAGEKILQSVDAPEAVKKITVKKADAVKEVPTSEALVKSITEVTQEQIRAAVLAKKDTHREEIKAVFAGFGCEKIPALKPEQYRDFLTKIEAL